MPLLNLTVRHGRTLEDASRGLELAVQRMSGQFGPLVRRVEWAPDRHRVKLEVPASRRPASSRAAATA